MKRAIFRTAATTGVLCVLGAACSPSAAPEMEKARNPAAEAGWTRPPMIRAVERAGDALVFKGMAEPGARVVLRSETGPAHAAAADKAGRFEIRMVAPAGHLLLRPETQIGQNAALSPDRLLIVAGGRGPVAILRAGGPTRRLDRAPALGAVDSDGRMRLVSGRRSSAGGAIELYATGKTGRVVPDTDGRWSLVLTPSSGPDEIRVGGRSFLWPGDSATAASFQVERAGSGWRVAWSGPAGGRQTTWLPVPEG